MASRDFDGHPWHEKTRIVIEDPKDPIMQGMGDSFEIDDELYPFRNPYSRDKLHVLMRLDPEWVMKKLDQAAKLEADGKTEEAKKARADAANMKIGVKRDDNDYAMAWIRDYGKGRVFYTALGHEEKVWRDERFQGMLLNAMRWAVGETTADAEPSGVKR